MVGVQGSKVEAMRGDNVKFRAKNNAKKLKPRPDKLKLKKGELREEREEEDLDVQMEKIKSSVPAQGGQGQGRKPCGTSTIKGGSTSRSRR